MVLIKVGGFWAGKYEVTQRNIKRLPAPIPTTSPAKKQPVDSVSWNDAVEFCDKLTSMELDTNAVPKGFIIRCQPRTNGNHWSQTPRWTMP